MTNEEPSAGRFDDRRHILPVRVYYEDTDFSGVVYHASYLRFLERGRSDFLRLAGIHHKAMLEAAEPLAFAVSRMEIDFVRPARIDDALTVRTAFETMRGPRIFVAQALMRGDELLVRAKAEVCCISLAGRPRKPPALVSARLKPFLEPSPSSF
jgi:acyl-CoA thioester hydrolase